ncbi:MAG TPA: protoporphyrinogen oxidase [Bryobacteraceae bacterium]|nr:protoporphyrinogen oxidase [Bryobacteraceae bacterium]
MTGSGQRVAIVGAGISGLAAAYDLARAGVETTVFEKQSRAGGVISTRVVEGCTLECGPDSFLAAKPEAVALIDELGLGGEVIGSNDRQRTTYIWKRGRLVALPEGVMMMVPSRVMPMVKTPLVGWRTKIQMGLEYFHKPSDRGDRSVADFVTEHFGTETLDYLAEPLLSGVYGGDPAKLGIAGVLPRFLEMEKKYGSLVRGVVATRGGSTRSAPSPMPLFQTLKPGLGKLVYTLASRAEIVNAEVEAIERDGARFRVRAKGDWLGADHVVLACPAWAAGRLVGGIDGTLAELLTGIEYSSSITVSLIYRADDFDGRRAGFGFLVPKKERQRLAACTFVGTKFSYRVPGDKIALRCFFGGAGDAAILNETDDALVGIARDELRGILGLEAAPVVNVIARWPRSMAQYTVGHGLRIAEIRARAAALSGLYLAGNAYEGIGISDCIRTGRAAAKAIVFTLTS